ncbi:SGNH/GDSL hydrolase family protein [Nocardioides salsibiostraticola]
MRSLSDHLPSGRRLLRLFLVVTIGALITFVTTRVGDQDSEPTLPPIEYVALGDSYTSAPYVPPQTPDDPCLQSGGNYPHLLAAEIPALQLTDVSCGAATTTNMIEPQVLGEDQLPPQFDALSAQTDLVTIGIGANDSAVFASLIYACFPGVRTGAICHGDSPRGTALQLIIDQIQDNVQGVLTAILTRSPSADVIVVPYPQIIAADTRCPDLIPFEAEDSAYIADVNRRISQALIDAAIEVGVEYVDVLAASAGHDICAADPWVMGSRTDIEVAASFHPLPVEQRAVADLVRERLCDLVIPC